MEVAGAGQRLLAVVWDPWRAVQLLHFAAAPDHALDLRGALEDREVVGRAR